MNLQHQIENIEILARRHGYTVEFNRRAERGTLVSGGEIVPRMFMVPVETLQAFLVNVDRKG